MSAMEALLQSLPNLKIRQKVRDDDTVDQLHHFVTVCLLAFAGFLIGLKEMVGEPLDCWVNMSNWKHFQGHVNSYCWAHKLYKFPNLSDLSETPYPIKVGLAGPEDSNADTDFGEINFYRWVTIIFFVQAFLFKLPALIWSECNEYSGTQIEKMVGMVTESTFEPTGKRDTTFAILAEYIEVWLKINRKPFHFMRSRIGQHARKILNHCMLCVGGNTGNYLSTMYLIIKFLFLLNVFMQFVILTSFLDFNYWHYGPYAVSASADGRHNIHFPRVGLCHFQMRGEGHWIQCILSINMILEIIFVIEWFWLLLLLVITCISFITWILRTLQTQRSVIFVTKYLSILNPDGRPPREGLKTIRTFVMNYLGNDGVFVLRIMATNTNDVAMAELVSCVWKRYLRYENRDSRSEKDGSVFEMEPIEHKDFV